MKEVHTVPEGNVKRFVAGMALTTLGYLILLVCVYSLKWLNNFSLIVLVYMPVVLFFAARRLLPANRQRRVLIALVVSAIASAFVFYVSLIAIYILHGGT